MKLRLLNLLAVLSLVLALTATSIAIIAGRVNRTVLWCRPIKQLYLSTQPGYHGYPSAFEIKWDGRWRVVDGEETRPQNIFELTLLKGHYAIHDDAAGTWANEHGIIWTQRYTTAEAIIPAWQPVLLLFMFPAIWFAWLVWHRHPPSATRCRKCGYDLRATPGRCPECGMIPKKTA